MVFFLMSLLRPLLLSVALATLVILLGTTALSFSVARGLLAEDLRAQGLENAARLALESPIWRGYLVAIVALIAGAGLLWAGFVIAIVRWLKIRVLGEVAEKVRDMQRLPEGSLALPSDVISPWSPDLAELSEVSAAVNETREKLKLTSAEQHAQIESLKAALNSDPLTRLVNRRYFMNALRAALAGTPLLEDGELPGDEPIALPPSFGHVLVCRQRDLAALNRHMPRDFTDQWLRTTAQRLTAILTGPDGHSFVLARLNGSDFAVLMPGVDVPRAAAFAAAIRQVLRESRLPVGEGGLCRWALSLVRYGREDQVSDLLAALDHGLMRSENAGDESVAFGADTDAHVAAGEFAWKDTLSTALEENRYFLETAPVTATDGRKLPFLARLMLQPAAGSPPVPPELFIPAAVRLGLSASCDLQAVRLALDWLMIHSGAVCVRISTPSLVQNDFLARLAIMLADRKDLATRLLLEIDAHAITTQYPRVASLCQSLVGYGVRIGVRRLAQQFTAVAQLHQLRLAYVRIGGGFVEQLSNSPGGRQLMRSVLKTSGDLGIEVYADDVPDTRTRDLLSAMGIRVMQGAGVAEDSPELAAA